MSTYDKASLVLIPSGTKEGVVFSQKPTNGDGDFTFTRASSATRVNSDGLIEKETQNLILQSNSFDTTWLNQLGGTITSGQAGYDGSNDAWLISKDTSIYRSVRQVVSWNGVSTFSVYAKEGSLSDAALRLDTGAGVIQVLYDITDGSITSTSGAYIDAGSIDIGNGWYRLYVSANVSSGTNVHIFADRDGTTAGNIYIQDAQLNQGLVADSYLETTTTAVYGGITDNIPRLDYTDASCPSLLLEPQRTNIIPYSEYIDGLDIFNATTSFEDITSPEGNNGVYEVTTTTTTQNHFVSNDNIITASTTYTISGYFKKSTKRYCYIGINQRTSGGSYIGQYTVIFDLDTATWGNSIQEATYPTYVNKDFVDVGNGWYRLILTCTLGATAGILRSVYGIANSSNGTFYGGSDTDAIYLWGVQAEEASYATSYIPTYGASVTRVGETCNNAGNASTFNSEEGVIYAEISGFENDLSNRRISLSDGTANNSIRIFYYIDGGTVFFRKYVGGVQTSIVTITSINQHELTKIAIKYNSTNFDIFANGVKISTNLDSNSFPTNTLNKIGFADGSGTGTPFYGNAKQVLVFTTALTDEELADLTTI